MSSAGDSEEIILSEGDEMQELDTASVEEELDAGVHEQAAMDIPRAAEEEASEEESEQTAVVPSGAAAAAAADAADIISATPTLAAESAPPQQQQQAADALGPAATQAAAGEAAAAPKGLGGLGLRAPAAARSAGSDAAAAAAAAAPQQQQPAAGGDAPTPAPAPAQQQQQPAQPAAAPKGLGLGGLGLGSKLPPRQQGGSTSTSSSSQPGGAAGGPASSSSAAAAAGAGAGPATAAAAAAAPQKPAGGIGLLPPKPKAAAAAGANAEQQPQQPQTQPPQQQQQLAASKPAGGIGALPAKQPAPAAAAAAGAGGMAPRPAAAGGSSFRPVLPGCPAVAAGGGGAQVVRSAAGGPIAAAAAGGGAAGGGGVVDYDEPKAMQRMRQQLQELRVAELAAGMRLGFPGAGPELTQWVGVLDRVEKVNAPPLRRRVDVNKLALADAMELNAREAPDSPLNISMKLMVVGMTGTGKSELINALLGRPALPTNAFRESTRHIRVVKGRVAGMAITAIDTPGLHASADAQAANRSLIKALKGAWKRHKPNFLVYVDRLDASRPSFGEMGLLSSVTAALGQGAWKKSLVVLTHANAARDQLGKEYLSVVKQRKNITQNIIRQAAGEMQLRINLHTVDLHPEGPRNAAGEPIIYDQTSPLSASPGPVAWRPNVLLNMLGLYAFETAVEMISKAQPKPKGAKAGAGAGGAKQQDMFRQMMRSRLPPTSFFVEQLVEGVAKPEGWAVPEDPFGAETDDEEAEEFKHIYYKLMLSMARRGDPRAQKEYAAWLRRLERSRRAYQEAYENEEVEALAAYGYEGYVAEGLDLGPSFDPEDATDHRYQYVLTDSPFAIMPTLDYYGYEHEDAITGFVAEWSGQPFNTNGWGGVPVDVTATIEKDKTTTCLQAEANASIVHSVAPFGNRHITQLTGAFELLRPNVKDVLYTLEVNTFKDGLLKANDHAGAGLMVTRMAENGHIKKGPVGVGVRIQESMRVGPFKVEAVAAQVRGETPMGGRDEGWGARAFVLHDWIPGVAMNFDWYQERTKDESSIIGGWASALAYDFSLPGGYPAGVELDWVSGSDVLHVDASLFSASDWKPAWLLLLPAVNWARDRWRRWRESSRGGAGGEEGLEGEEEDDEGEGGAMMPGDLGAMLQGMSGPDAQAMLQQLMQSGGLQQLMGGRGA